MKNDKPKFAKLMRGYLGFLTGRGKSLATIDLRLFIHWGPLSRNCNKNHKKVAREPQVGPC